MTDTMRLAERLCDAAATVPEPVARAARLHLIDAIGVGVAASAAGPVPGVSSLADACAGPSTVFGRSDGTSPALAALANGALIHSLEFDDTHTASVVHGSSVLAAAALAAAEATGATGRELVSAFAVGWELFIRIGLASPGGLQRQGFQVTSAGGPFAAAAVSALLHRDEPAILAHALGIAGSQAGGTFAFLATGDTVKAAQVGWAAHAGVMAAELARAGVTGPAAVFDGPYGFYRLYARDDEAGTRFGALVETLGAVWQLPEAAFKLLPCCHYLHPFVEALQQALRGVDPRDVVGIHCEVPTEVVPIIAEPWAERQRPPRTQDARWSLPYVMGEVVRHGGVDAATFVGEVDREVLAAAELVSYEPWEGSGFPTRFPARIRVRFRDATERRVEIDDVRGGSSRPLEDDLVVGKARENLRIGGVPAAAAEDLLGTLLDAAPDLARVSAALRAPRIATEQERAHD